MAIDDSSSGEAQSGGTLCKQEIDRDHHRCGQERERERERERGVSLISDIRQVIVIEGCTNKLHELAW